MNTEGEDSEKRSNSCSGFIGTRDDTFLALLSTTRVFLPLELLPRCHPFFTPFLNLSLKNRQKLTLIVCIPTLPTQNRISESHMKPRNIEALMKSYKWD